MRSGEGTRHRMTFEMRKGITTARSVWTNSAGISEVSQIPISRRYRNLKIRPPEQASALDTRDNLCKTSKEGPPDPRKHAWAGSAAWAQRHYILLSSLLRNALWRALLRICALRLLFCTAFMRSNSALLIPIGILQSQTPSIFAIEVTM